MNSTPMVKSHKNVILWFFLLLLILFPLLKYLSSRRNNRNLKPLKAPKKTFENSKKNDSKIGKSSQKNLNKDLEATALKEVHQEIEQNINNVIVPADIIEEPLLEPPLPVPLQPFPKDEPHRPHKNDLSKKGAKPNLPPIIIKKAKNRPPTKEQDKIKKNVKKNDKNNDDLEETKSTPTGLDNDIIEDSRQGEVFGFLFDIMMNEPDPPNNTVKCLDTNLENPPPSGDNHQASSEDLGSFIFFEKYDPFDQKKTHPLDKNDIQKDVQPTPTPTPSVKSPQEVEEARKIQVDDAKVVLRAYKEFIGQSKFPKSRHVPTLETINSENEDYESLYSEDDTNNYASNKTMEIPREPPSKKTEGVNNDNLNTSEQPARQNGQFIPGKANNTPQNENCNNTEDASNQTNFVGPSRSIESKVFSAMLKIFENSKTFVQDFRTKQSYERLYNLKFKKITKKKSTDNPESATKNVKTPQTDDQQKNKFTQPLNEETLKEQDKIFDDDVINKTTNITDRSNLESEYRDFLKVCFEHHTKYMNQLYINLANLYGEIRNETFFDYAWHAYLKGIKVANESDDTPKFLLFNNSLHLLYFFLDVDDRSTYIKTYSSYIYRFTNPQKRLEVIRQEMRRSPYFGIVHAFNALHIEGVLKHGRSFANDGRFHPTSSNTAAGFTTDVSNYEDGLF